MARPTRLILDLALGSLSRISPAISKIWTHTKIYVEKTPAKNLLKNPIVFKIEEKASLMTEFLAMKLTYLRNKQLPKEIKYLQRQLDIVKQKMEEAAATKTIKSEGSIAWHYFKHENSPPMMTRMMTGSLGNKIGGAADKVISGIIGTLEGLIKSMEEQERQKLQAIEDAKKAILLKQLAEEKKKLDEARSAAKKIIDEAAKIASAKAAKEKEDSKAKAKADTKKKPDTPKGGKTKAKK